MDDSGNGEASLTIRLYTGCCNEPGILLVALGKVWSLSGWYDILSSVHRVGSQMELSRYKPSGNGSIQIIRNGKAGTAIAVA